MAACGVVLPHGGIVFGADAGWRGSVAERFASSSSTTASIGGMAQWILGVRRVLMDSRRAGALTGVVVASSAGRENPSILSTPSPCCDHMLRAHLATILSWAAARMPSLTLPNMPMRLGRMVEMVLVGLPLYTTLTVTWVLGASRFADSKILFHRHIGISITAICYEYHGPVGSCVCQEG